MKGRNKMNIVILVVQIILAALYIMAGLWEVTGQAPMLEKMMPGLSLALIRLIGIAEALAGLGLVLPLVMRGWGSMAGWAGAFLAIEAAVFVAYNLLHKAYMPLGATLVLGLLAALVAWAKFG